MPIVSQPTPFSHGSNKQHFVGDLQGDVFDFLTVLLSMMFLLLDCVLLNNSGNFQQVRKSA